MAAYTTEEKNTKSVSSEKMFSLKKSISVFISMFLIIILLLFSVILFAMVIQYQTHQNEKRMNDLAAYAQKVDENLVQLNDIVGEIYSSNNDFDEVDMFLPVSEKWDSIYALQNLCRIQVKSNQNMSGLFISYKEVETKQNQLADDIRLLYYVNENIPFAELEQIKKAVRDVIDYKVRDYTTAIISTESERFYGVFLKQNLSALSGIFELNIGLPGELEKGAAYGVIYEGEFYKTGGEKGLELLPEECSRLKEGKNRLDDKVVYLYDLSVADMDVVEILPQSIWLYVNGLHIVTLLIGIAFVGCSVYLYRFVSRELSEPLEDMNNTMQQIGVGEWEINFAVPNRIQEIENVRQTVKGLLSEVEQYKITTYEETLKRQKIQLQYLQLQLAPHFFTNCLKNIYYMLLLKEYENVEQVLLNLTTHLRYLLQKDVTMVTVEQERDFILNYVELQKKMNEKQISCKLAIDEDVLAFQIPILALQTFVENSIKYTQGREKDGLSIQISVRKRRMEERDYLYISVIDNGIGYPDEMLNVLNQEEPSEKQSLGVGIINLLNRVCIQYGSGAKWYFDNMGGALSELFIPVEEHMM